MADGEDDGAPSPALARVLPERPATPEELAAWVTAEYRGLIRFACLVAGDSHVAGDLVQAAYLRALRAKVRIAPTTGAYFRRTIANTWRTTARRHLSEQAAWGARGFPQEVPAPREPDPMWEAVKRLPDRQRAVLALRYYEDLSERETADVLGISIGSVKKHASRAIARLREEMQ